jgi:phosphoglycolate phosphatase-like HAD superfamily hydrolase
MHQIYNYDIYIFDCDGVILDSNQLKIDAMRRALTTVFSDNIGIEDCVNYFKKNFGKSRFHHVNVFLSDYLLVDEQARENIRKEILRVFSLMCKELYLEADLTPGFIDFISTLQGKKFVASGSEQEELREVFRQRGLTHYFNGIFGSPTAKVILIDTILQGEKPDVKAVMFGDALSDLYAAVENKIDFIFYSPFSNVELEMRELCLLHGFRITESFKEILKEI